MSGPLAGLRVVDCSSGLAGPKATGLLADYGADVIWVERPGGDKWRDDLDVAYSVFNRSKRSVTLDLTDPAQRARLIELATTADVFVESWRPGVADRLGIGYDVMHRAAPHLVYCSISGYGKDSRITLPGHDSFVNAVIGTMGDQAGYREGPIFVAVPSASSGAAYLAMIGILSAVARRDEDGHGRHVDTSLLDGMLAYVAQSWGYSANNPVRYRTGGTRFYIKTLRCADDEYIGVHTAARGAFDRLMAVVGLDDRVRPVDGAQAATILSEDEEDALAQMPDIFETEPRKVWLERLLDANICAIPVLRPTEVFDEPQVVHNQMVTITEDPVLGRVEQLMPPAKFDATPAEVGTGAPTTGQHTAEVLAENAPPRSFALADTPDDRPLLEGLKVLDMGHWFAGPYASRLLAELGADVIKLEPIDGDPMRGLERPFSAAQSGKRAIAVDLRHPDSAEICRALFEWADVVHHNMRPGVAERLGVGYDDVKAVNPNAVYLHATGWGHDGPDVNRQSLAPLMAGYVGADYEAAGQFNPPVDPVANEDSGGGLVGAVSALMALYSLRHGGCGQYIDSPHLHSALVDVSHIVRRSSDGEVLGAGKVDPMQYGVGPLHRLYQTADGWLCLFAHDDAQITGLERALGVSILSDDRFVTASARADNSYDLEELIGDAFLARDTATLVADLAAAGVDVVEPVYENNRAFMDDEENLRIGRVGQSEHPRFGMTRQAGLMVRTSDITPATHRGAPEFGQHTDEILTDLGYSADRVAELRANNVVR